MVDDNANERTYFIRDVRWIGGHLGTGYLHRAFFYKAVKVNSNNPFPDIGKFFEVMAYMMYAWSIMFFLLSIAIISGLVAGAYFLIRWLV